ncbi:RHTO0S03e13212g1_1 [Rhodotorula toruloides]|uniref:RHTO0S03e13212g1_1 n=2 Tax=Rhodotorula toruloides TaxID=5286 RepID=A0A061ATR8_RHOTO|nr:uncharacterized protein RHTO_00619 [Rhodotorula toruloides NP11]EMS26191.1 hypothetical protein RHTO_00619 [Rhodotorula toruloides NP11]CDR38785.1 RHTO0S03e13212g1_1 [Rhodotorula toruloides]
MCREYCTDALVRRGSSGYRSATTSSGSQVPFERAQLACHCCAPSGSIRFANTLALLTAARRTCNSSPGSIFIAWQDLSPKPLRPPFLSLCPRLSFARQLFRLAASVFCYDRR